MDISRESWTSRRSRSRRPPRTRSQDPRVAVHVEDGRFFLQTTPQSFDLITAEPPPLKAAGVVNLYSREYFAAHARPAGTGRHRHVLAARLPAAAAETASVMRAFCGVFADCTLWTAAGLEWMLAGTKRRARPSADEFGAQWSDPVVGPQLRDVGFERPSSWAPASWATRRSWHLSRPELPRSWTTSPGACRRT